MTEDQLNALADIISKKVIAYLDQALDVEVVRPMTAEEFFHSNVDAFGNVKHYDQKAIIEKQLEQLDEQREKLLREEKYELLVDLNEIYKRLKRDYENL